jgi:putative oxidoreductase
MRGNMRAAAAKTRISLALIRATNYCMGERGQAPSMSDIATPKAHHPHSILGAGVDVLVGILARIPYSLVALISRLVMARVFFLSGQARIEGPRIPVHLPLHLPFLANLATLDFTITLPRELTPAMLALFETQYAGLPMPPAVAAWLFAYAEFVLPICLVIGFATRFAALALLIITALIALLAAPAQSHVYWIAILLPLISLGPGVVSIDALIRTLYRREQEPVGRIGIPSRL